MEILVPIFICAIMPMAIVFITAYAKISDDRQRANIIMKAIETNPSIDADKLVESLKKKDKSRVRTPLQVLNLRLLRGCIFTLIGIGLTLAGILAYANGLEYGADPVCIPLIFGFISLAVGISYLVVYFVTRKQVMKDAEREARRREERGEREESRDADLELEIKPE